jgi:DNA-binding transcriptional ArsR family regulator
MKSTALLALEWKPIDLVSNGEVVIDIFKHNLSATDGLPPYTQARIIDLISNQLKKCRQSPALWISVDALGTWYLRELQRLVKRRIPIAILQSNQTPQDRWDFKPYPASHHLDRMEVPRLVQPFQMGDYDLRPRLLRILRILARLKNAYTREITSLAGFSETYVRNLLRQLQEDGLIERKQIGKYYGWAIRNRGLSLAHRSWNVPKGVHFKKYRGEFRYAGEHHRRVARMWRAWLEAAYPWIEIWECWTEIPVHYGIPDALAWGHTGKHEILFWLEVDSGHSSKEIMHRNYHHRIWTAYDHAKEWGIPIVFCLMGPPWVVKEFPRCIPRLLPNLAMIGHDWSDFGRLPVYEFSEWHEDLSWTQHQRNHNSSEGLPFDPKQYPLQPKQKILKLSKPKSTKPRFSKDSEDGGYRPSGEFEIEE